jgi:hypothetical protein
MRLTQIIRDDRGVALPMAMLVLVLLTTLMMAFAMLAQTEPVIAHNQNRAAQARAQAEAGFERAVWALSQGVVPPPAGSGVPFSLPSPLPDPNGVSPGAVTAPAPYGGTTFIQNGSSGGFRVTVRSLAPVTKPHEREITSIGFTPSDTENAADKRTKSHRTIRATVERFPLFAWETPCALCVRGDLQVGGSALIDGAADLGCGGYKKGAVTTGTIELPPAQGSGVKIVGDSNGTPNEDNSDYLQNQTDPNLFAGITLTAANLKALRERAKQKNTYFGPGYPDGSPAGSPTWSGQVTFESSHKLMDGIVFIDTVSGNDIPTNMAEQNPSDFASVEIRGNPFVNLAGFTGWIIVNGSLRINGDMKINGLVYAMNDLTYNGVGDGQIQGLAISQNIRDTNATAISSSDSATTGNSRVKFNCNALQPPPDLNIGFTLVKGTYRELDDIEFPVSLPVTVP